MQEPGAISSDQCPSGGDSSSSDSTGIVGAVDSTGIVARADRVLQAAMARSHANEPTKHRPAIDVPLPSAAALEQPRGIVTATALPGARPLDWPKLVKR
jgi:hypothetical protein